MKLIVVSSPTDLQGEHELINALLEAGLEYFHLRKPEYSIEQQEAFLKKIKPAFLRRVVLHQHYKLIEKYNLRGIHLKESFYKELKEGSLSDFMREVKRKKISVSLSLHNPDELKALEESFSYVFLSPVFDSISKGGYMANKSIEAISSEIRQKVIALGGIDEETIPKLTGRNFSGVALLGAIWEEFQKSENVKEVTEKFKRIQNAILD